MTTLDKIRQWASDRNLIHGSTIGAQCLKLNEELGEAAGALARLPAARGDADRTAELMAKAKDGFGDVVVVLTIMAAQAGIRLEDCIEIAYDEIKDRRGRVVNGVFVKDGEA